MYRKFLFLTSFVLVLSLAYTSYGADVNAPTPNPMTWALVPSSSSLTSITMRATHAVDPCVAPDGNSPPVQYYFGCLAPNTAKSSLWQTSEEYTATGLTRGNIYWFRVRTRDSAPTPNVGTYSALKSEIAGTARLDFDAEASTAAETEAGFNSFHLGETGKDVCGIIIDLAGNLRSKRMSQPYYEPADSNHEQIYRDMISGFTNTSPITITLWGLGADRDCNITLYAYDAGSTPNRVADWNSNGTYIFTTDFNGGTSVNWPFSTKYPGDRSWTEPNRADYLGRIVLKSWPDPCTAANQPFAFANALVVAPKGTFVPTKYAWRQQPFDGVENATIDTVLKWRKGDGVVTHDLYFGDACDVVYNATRNSHPGVLIYAPDLAADYGKDVNGNIVYDPCGATGFLELDKTYYWVVDENDGGGPPPVYYEAQEVASFKTLPYFVVDNFNSYTGDTLSTVWYDHWNQDLPITQSTLFCQRGLEDANFVRGGIDSNSIMYVYNNDTSPFYSEAYADIATLGDDPDWLGIGAKSLSLWFYGPTSNPITENMYVKLTDGDNPAHTAQVIYAGDVNALREPWWHEWNIDLQDFADGGVDLTNVSRLIIGFGDGGGSGTDGYMYFEDIQLYVTRCALVGRSGDFARLDFAPGGAPAGDCVIDYREIGIMAGDWLQEDAVIATHNPGDANLVVYYAMNEGAGTVGDSNKMYSRPDLDNPDVCDPKWTGTFYNGVTTPPGNGGTSWATPGAPDIGGEHCVYFNGTQGTRVQCGSTYGQLNLGTEDFGIGVQRPTDINAITLSVWVKSLGPRSWDPYLLSKFMGLVGKRGGWSEDTVTWMFSVTPDAQAFCLTSYQGGLYSANILSPYFGQWIHLAATYPNPPTATDANSQARIYLNGGQVNQGLFRFSHGYDPNIFLSIGCTQDINAWMVGCPESFNGYIDEVRVYNRCLEPNEIGYLADSSPEDGYQYVPVQSAAELYTETSNVGTNLYAVTVTDTDQEDGVIDGSSDGYTAGSTAYGWYRYPESGWWNVWFNNQPYDKNRYKVDVIELTLEPTDDGAYATIIAGGSTGAWDANASGKVRPPLPSDVDAITEPLYINRTEPNNVIFNGPVEGTMVISKPIFIWSCNPGWAFIDVRGTNFTIIDGYIRHECRIVGEVNFKDFAVLANNWLKEEMFPLP